MRNVQAFAAANLVLVIMKLGSISVRINLVIIIIIIIMSNLFGIFHKINVFWG